MVDSTNPRVMADNIKELDARTLGTIAEAEALQIYDDEETDTGKKWIDGSPIYRKCFVVDSLTEGEYTGLHGITNLGIVTSINGSIICASIYALNYNISASYRTATWFTNANIRLTVGSALVESFVKAIICIEYTKAATPDVLPSPDPDTRTLEEPETESEPEPIEEKK